VSPAGLVCAGLGRAIGGRWLYRGLDLSLEAGSMTVIVGPNGAGKSTLLRDLAGLRAPHAGTITLGGAPLATISAATRARRLAYLPQQTPLSYDLSVAEVVMLGRTPALPRFGAPGPADRAAVAEALAATGLTGLATRGITGLSGGERQRVMLARMLASGAPLLLLDEPTSSLDIGFALGFLALCRRLAGAGRALAVALHDLDLARRHADQAVLLVGDGEVRVGDPAAILGGESVSAVFGVQAREIDGHLVFEGAG
jgi:ABC-type cobalamin/Fe3+-siderophores transport system ATPase subunit